MTRTQQESWTIPRSHQVRQIKEQQFEGIEEYDCAVDPRTGWRFCKTARGNLSPSSPSFSSTNWERNNWTTRSWNSWHSSRSDHSWDLFFFQIGPVSVEGCRQTHLSHDMFAHVQIVRTDHSQSHSLITRTRVAQVVCLGSSKVVRHVSHVAALATVMCQRSDLVSWRQSHSDCWVRGLTVRYVRGGFSVDVAHTPEFNFTLRHNKILDWNSLVEDFFFQPPGRWAGAPKLCRLAWQVAWVLRLKEMMAHRPISDTPWGV